MLLAKASLDPMTILALQCLCWGPGALLLGFGVVQLRRNRLPQPTAEVANTGGHPFPKSLQEIKPASARGRGGCLGMVCLWIAVPLLILPFTGIFHLDYNRIARHLERRLAYRAPRYTSEFQSSGSPIQQSLTARRGGFRTRLRKKMAAPQEGDTRLAAPTGAELVHYPSEQLDLKAWVSPDPGDGEQHPAILYLHGGFALGASDWEVLAAYRDAGFVTMTPSLRGENGNPGHFEFFYGEVEDALAAGRYLAELPYVDKQRIHVTGHSIGGLLCVLTAVSDSVFRGAVAFSPTRLDVASWLEEIQNDKQRGFDARGMVVFNPKSREEVGLRNPNEFAHQLQIPLVMYIESRGALRLSDSFSHRAKRADKAFLARRVHGADHSSMLPLAIEESIPWLQFLGQVDTKEMRASNIDTYWHKQSADAFEVAKNFTSGDDRLDVESFSQFTRKTTEQEILTTLGEPGHRGDSDPTPKLQEAVQRLTRTTQERRWTRDSGSTITTGFNEAGLLVSLSMGGSDEVFRAHFRALNAKIAQIGPEEVEQVLDADTFAVVEQYYRYLVWTSDSQVLVVQLDEAGGVRKLLADPPIKRRR